MRRRFQLPALQFVSKQRQRTDRLLQLVLPNPLLFGDVASEVATQLLHEPLRDAIQVLHIALSEAVFQHTVGLMCVLVDRQAIWALYIRVGLCDQRQTRRGAGKPRVRSSRRNATKHVAPTRDFKSQLCSDATADQSRLLPISLDDVPGEVLLAHTTLLPFDVRVSAIRQRYALALVILSMPVMLNTTEYKLDLRFVSRLEVFSLLLDLFRR